MRGLLDTVTSSTHHAQTATLDGGVLEMQAFLWHERLTLDIVKNTTIP